MPFTVRVLTWNIFYGSYQGSSFMDRLRRIMKICQENNVDIVSLQEVPSGLGSPSGTQSGYNYAYKDGEYDPSLKGPTNVSRKSGSYLTLYSSKVFLASLGFFRSQDFKNQVGTYLRPPFRIQCTINGKAFSLFNWHAPAAGVDAETAVETLNYLAATDQTMTTDNNIIAGDLNVRYNKIRPLFKKYDDLSADVGGKDHILANGTIKDVLADKLNFKSDHHFPVAADITFK
jgi:exonuclease III